MQNSKRVAINTGVQYVKMVFTMIISLYSTRLILLALGQTDFGIYSLISGVIAMLSFLDASMSVSTQRYLSFNIGTGTKEKLNEIFNSSIVMHFILGVIIVAILEGGGVYLFDKVLQIPENRVHIAKLVFHFMIISTFFTVISTPFDAAITAKEDLTVTAGIDILISFFKLAIAIYLTYSSFDKLMIYAILMAGITIINIFLKILWCNVKYNELKVKIYKTFNKESMFEMTSFAGWNTFGSVCAIGRNQGIAIIINVFFGTIVNAAYGIANQINAQLYFFSASLLKAFRPQIVKSGGANDRIKMMKLAIIASKFSFFLMALFSIPLMLELPFVLKLWLKEVPQYTTIFCRLILAITLVNQLSVGLPITLQAIGAIKWYQINVSSLVLLILPIGCVFLKLGYPVYSILVVSLVIEFITVFLRMVMVEKYTSFSSLNYIKMFVLTVILPVSISFLFTLIPFFFLDYGILRVIIVITLSSVSMLFFIYKIGLNEYEREKIILIVSDIKKELSGCIKIKLW